MSRVATRSRAAGFARQNRRVCSQAKIISELTIIVSRKDQSSQCRLCEITAGDCLVPVSSFSRAYN